ncbi:hypothetical protein B0H10DRAFT_1960805 [Mycena sp. CBHHK59/15]|nr:hypothetical protein B0H10DRAFT_1960805 [Mycena sp. CBHHK59/15]
MHAIASHGLKSGFNIASFIDSKDGSAVATKPTLGASRSKSLATLPILPASKGLWDSSQNHRHPERLAPQVSTVVMGHVRELLQPQSRGSVDERVNMLESCAQFCTRHKVDMPSLLRVGDCQPPTRDLVRVHSCGPQAFISADTMITEARRACIALDNQDMFHSLRLCPEFEALSVANRFLLGVLVPPEEIVVKTMAGDAMPFSVHFKIPQYKRRMLLSKAVKLEFIARGRMWTLSFFVANKPTQAWLEDGSGLWSLKMPGLSHPQEINPRSRLVQVKKKSHPPGITGSIIPWSMSMFEADTFYIREDSSLEGTLGVKLGTPKPFKSER